jgi:hypothetical protein
LARQELSGLALLVVSTLPESLRDGLVGLEDSALGHGKQFSVRLSLLLQLLLETLGLLEIELVFPEQFAPLLVRHVLSPFILFDPPLLVHQVFALSLQELL